MKTAAGEKRIGRDLTEGPILKTLLIFALPMILSNIIQQLYSMVDLMVIGKFVGSIGTVAVSNGSELIDFMTMSAMAFSAAGQIYIAQLAGAKDEKRIREATGTLFSLMLLMLIVFTAIPIVLHRPLLGLIKCPEKAYGEAVKYLIVTACGVPFVFGYNAICALLRGMGESRRPLIFIIIAASVNVALDLIFVAWFKMGAVGTAIATAASQAGSFAAAFIFLWRNRGHFGFTLSRSYFKIYAQPMRVIIRLGVPQFVRILCIHGSMIWVKANINDYGLSFSAAYGIGTKMERLMQSFQQGIDGAAGAMEGQNIGARKHKRVNQALFTALGVAMVIGSAAALLFLLAPRWMYGFFTSDPAVRDIGVVFLRVMAVGCLIAAFSGAFKSITTGVGVAMLSFIIGVSDGFCRIGVSILFSQTFALGSTGYFWGAATCQLIPGLIAMVYFLSGKWKKKKLLSET